MFVPLPYNEWDGPVNLAGFVVSGDEQLFVGANSKWEYDSGLNHQRFEDTSLSAFYFGSSSGWEQGGHYTVLTGNGAYSIDERYESWGYNMSPGTGGGSITCNLRRYGSLFEVLAVVSSWKSWDSQWGEVYGYSYHGDEKMFNRILPLPDNRLVGNYARGDGYLDFLDGNLHSLNINTRLEPKTNPIKNTIAPDTRLIIIPPIEKTKCSIEESGSWKSIKVSPPPNKLTLIDN